MGIPELLLIAVGLAMDAFAVAVCTGLGQKRFSFADALKVGLWFGCAQAVMPVIGWLIGVNFSGKIEPVDHWIAFGLLAFIGIKMIVESFRADGKAKSGEDPTIPEANPFKPSKLFPLAIATSIDALAVGVSFAFLKVEIAPAAILIGVITLGLSVVGVRIGIAFGAYLRTWATFAGGIILIAIGVKILIEHLGSAAG